MKFTSFSALLALLVCIWGVRCDDDLETAVEEISDAPEIVGHDIIATEIDEDAVAESDASAETKEEQPSWGQWFNGMIWGNEKPVAAESAESEEVLAEDEQCCGHCEGHGEDDTEGINVESTTAKRNVKKIVLITIIVIVAAIAVIALLAFYLSKRGVMSQNKPIVSA
ncbi:hypothetical protein XU18_1957 [Perkinsela sp. CCAP 1560/4]|nr:hypothetical protein XU18_1957 [Perkinsela sp. CCAP 1560/4]|eukprot:KNH07425.1 hypothetical protein XU18_1957 [Perkinsela sp. CCAP 1560/4]